MGRDDERMRVRERLGALEGRPHGRRAVRGGRWDHDEILTSEGSERDDDRFAATGRDDGGGNRVQRDGAAGDRFGRERAERDGGDDDSDEYGAFERDDPAHDDGDPDDVAAVRFTGRPVGWGAGLDRDDDVREGAQCDEGALDPLERERVQRRAGRRIEFARSGHAENEDQGWEDRACERPGPAASGWDEDAEHDRFDRDDAGYAGRSVKLGLAPEGWDDGVVHPRTPHWLSEPVGSMSVWHERLVPERFRGVRWNPGWRGVLVLAGVGMAAVAVAAAVAQRERPVAQPVPPLPAVRTSDAAEPSGGSEPSTAAPTPAAPVDLVVSVVGLVEHAGLLHLPPGSRVADAVTIAVARAGADLARLNLAQRLFDGDQIIVGALGPGARSAQLGSAIIAGGERPGGSPRPSGAAASGPAAKVDLNTATESELDALPGVGPATARAIVAWRTEHGRFASIDQLAEVPGLGRSRLARLRELVTI
ncbi:helix-hairpin-helix domain-containing protein [Nocardia alni]|uniref:helix-hairpin-helix domain-containing protein n=1 Tax=Nocardia alni TaxID=2815723 RepID=UPI0020B267A5|nr:helix-hairpin-helix domain-containing protein [Nocardia alni]